MLDGIKSNIGYCISKSYEGLLDRIDNFGDWKQRQLDSKIYEPVRSAVYGKKITSEELTDLLPQLENVDLRAFTSLSPRGNIIHNKHEHYDSIKLSDVVKHFYTADEVRLIVSDLEIRLKQKQKVKIRTTRNGSYSIHHGVGRGFSHNIYFEDKITMTGQLRQ